MKKINKEINVRVHNIHHNSSDVIVAGFKNKSSNCVTPLFPWEVNCDGRNGDYGFIQTVMRNTDPQHK